jgi:hypothetical protein
MRWDSTNDMIERALELRDAIDKFIVAAMADRSSSSEHRLDQDQLSNQDWNELEVLHKLLAPFKELTIEMQGNIRGRRMNGAIFDVLPAMDMLLNKLEDAKLTYQAVNSPFSSCINLGWAKLESYYCLTDRSIVYVVGVVLDPRLKFRYFENKWSTRQDWISTALARVRMMYH